MRAGGLLIDDPARFDGVAVIGVDEHKWRHTRGGQTVYQQMIAAHRHPDPSTGRAQLATLIDTAEHGIPDTLVEIRTLARTLKRRAADLLAYFDRPRTSNGPTEAINGRLEHLRGAALGFRNLRAEPLTCERFGTRREVLPGLYFSRRAIPLPGERLGRRDPAAGQLSGVYIDGRRADQ